MLLLFEFNFSMCANFDHTDAAGKFGNSLLQLLAIPIRVSVLDLIADLGNTSSNSLLIASAINDGGVVLGNDDATSATQYFKSNLL